MNILSKKAAMFGIDARIALVIFSSLSLVAGVVVISVSKTTQAHKYLDIMNEMGAAWEQYFADTGRSLVVASSSYMERLRTLDLVEDPGVRGWKGPYLDPDFYTSIGSDTSLVTIPRIDPSIAAYAGIRFNNLNTNWASGHHYYRQCRTAGMKCAIWASIQGFPDDTIFNEMDKIVDGGDGHWLGDVRKKDSVIYLKIVNRPNPLD